MPDKYIMSEEGTVDMDFSITEEHKKCKYIVFEALRIKELSLNMTSTLAFCMACL